MTYRFFITIYFCAILQIVDAQKITPPFFKASNPQIQFTGRVDYSNSILPRFWQPGVHFEFNFLGDSCGIVLQDEILWGSNHNYIELVVDGKPSRLQLKHARDTIWGKGDPLIKKHTAAVYKNTEANIGYLELVGVFAKDMLPPTIKPTLKMEFIGNSITCGTGSDESEIPCGKGTWYDQHNAYASYGAITARNLNAQFHLSSVSGIGLMHSCCNLDITMPSVFDKINLRNGTALWDFKQYQPDIVSICLGQNDGVQDSAIFTQHYIRFLQQLRLVYPNAYFLCITSPMADKKLRHFMEQTLSAIVTVMHDQGEDKVKSYFFKQQYHAGCDGHPSAAEHALIANELSGFIKLNMPIRHSN
jgi:hypothetical protein